MGDREAHTHTHPQPMRQSLPAVSSSPEPISSSGLAPRDLADPLDSVLGGMMSLCKLGVENGRPAHAPLTHKNTYRHTHTLTHANAHTHTHTQPMRQSLPAVSSSPEPISSSGLAPGDLADPLDSVLGGMMSLASSSSTKAGEQLKPPETGCVSNARSCYWLYGFTRCLFAWSP